MLQETWRFLDTGKEGALFNMALDEAILEAVSRGDSPPTFRVFGWHPEAITCGYSQKISDVLNTDSCHRDNIAVTRRLTGGSAIFHSNELAYSFVGSVKDPYFGGFVRNTIISVSSIICVALQYLGIDVSMSESDSYASKPEFSCFESSSRYEILVCGKKIAGHAQKRIGGYFLHQGSILFGSGFERLTDYLNDSEMSKDNKRIYSQSSTTLAAELNDTFDENRCKISLKHSFQKLTGTSLALSIPDSAELDETERLIDERYSSKGWIYRHEC